MYGTKRGFRERIMCLREFLATSHNHQISTQMYKAEQGIANINLLFSENISLGYKNNTVPLG